MVKILVIDDNADIRRMIRAMVAPLGYEVFEASDGVEGVEAYRRTPVDVVLLDIFMPEKDGLEALRDLRRIDPAVRAIAISGGGSHGFTGILKTASLMGAIRTLGKPFTHDQLLAALDEVLTRSG